MYPRYCKTKILQALEDTPVVVIAGPRQCGKTTLAKAIAQKDCHYITLDDLTTLELAQHDPVGFIRNLVADQVVIDEIQRVPELFLAIKQSVDENRQAGRFLLTGSANAFMLPQLSDSLAGRMEVISLLPLASCEINRQATTFLQKITSGSVPIAKQTRIRQRLIEKIIDGGFPEPLRRRDHVRRMAWHTQYIQSIIQKDIKDLGQLEKIDDMTKLIRVMCHQVGKLVNYSELAGRIGLSRATMKRYAQLLAQLFIFENLPAWHRNANKRVIKTSKLHIVDSGLLCALQAITERKIQQSPEKLDSLLESYVVCELRRLASWHDEPLYFYHYRDKDKVEVDLVIETVEGKVIGIEIKATATLRTKDFHGLERLKALAGDDFLIGVLLYDGDQTDHYSDKLYAAPIGALWS